MSDLMFRVPEAAKHRARRRPPWFAMGAILLALLPLVGIVLDRYDLGLPLFIVLFLHPGPQAAGLELLACIFAVAALIESRRPRARLTIVLCGLAIMTSVSYLVFLGRGVYIGSRYDMVQYGLIQVDGSVWEFQGKTKHAPHSLEELFGRPWPGFFLAPLDDRFWDDYLARNMWKDMMAAYCTQPVPGSDKWSWVGVWQHQRQEAAPAEVLQWVADQREAITWLDESFPLADLERIAQTASGRRGRMASAILGYRQEKAKKNAADAQKQGP